MRYACKVHAANCRDAADGFPSPWASGRRKTIASRRSVLLRIALDLESALWRMTAKNCLQRAGGRLGQPISDDDAVARLIDQNDAVGGVFPAHAPARGQRV